MRLYRCEKGGDIKHLLGCYILGITIALATMGRCVAAPLDGVTSFAYQLQEMNIQELRDAPFSLVVIDYSLDGTASTALTAEDVSIIRSGNGKKVIAYLSIGEAEEYRYYFRSSWVKRKAGRACNRSRTRSAPEWLDDPNPSFCGNYKVRYWKREWKRIVFGVRSGRKKSYMDAIIDADFDGVYLDIIDGYEYWKFFKRPSSERRKSAARDMVNFVVELARYARSTRGKSEFVVIPQNGAGIINEVSNEHRSRYIAAIDGIGAEDSFYYGSLDENNPLDPQQDVIADLGEFVAAGKKVLAIDYLTEPGLVSDFIQRACAEGFVPQVSRRELDSLSAHTTQSCVQ